MEPTTGESLTRLAEIAAAVSRVNQQQAAPAFPGFAGSRMNEPAPHPMLQVTAAAFAAANLKRRSNSSITPTADDILKTKGEADLPVALPPRKKIKRADESEDVRFREYQGKRMGTSNDLRFLVLDFPTSFNANTMFCIDFFLFRLHSQPRFGLKSSKIYAIFAVTMAIAMSPTRTKTMLLWLNGSSVSAISTSLSWRARGQPSPTKESSFWTRLALSGTPTMPFGKNDGTSFCSTSKSTRIVSSLATTNPTSSLLCGSSVRDVSTSSFARRRLPA
jgi:hypothetical protein